MTLEPLRRASAEAVRVPGPSVHAHKLERRRKLTCPVRLGYWNSVATFRKGTSSRHCQSGPAPRRSNHPALLDELTARGVATVGRHDDSAARDYVHFRTATDRYIRAYARNAGYDPDSVRPIYSRWARDTALKGHADAHANGRVAS